jgi:type IV pilus assembly protein PilM
MGLFGRSKTTVGLDIGSGYVKLVAMDHSGPEPEIVQTSISPLVADAIVEGEVMDPGLVAEAIRGAIQGAGLKAKRVAVAVGGHDVITKTIKMDRMSATDARQVIRWEAEQHVPFDMESVELDFQILDPEGDGSQMSVLLVAAKRELIHNRLSMLADAGLSASAVDVESFALYNAFERNYMDGTGGLTALVHVGNETTNVNLLQDGAPVLVRDLPFGARRVREALQRERGLSAEEADAVMRGKGDETVDVSAFIQERSEELALGVERAAALFTAEALDGGVDRVFVSGGGARIPGIVDALANRMGVRCEVVNPFARVAVQPDVMQVLDLDDVAPMLMLAVGLALRQPN